MPDESSKTQIYINRYFRNQSQNDEGEHTRILKRAYTQVRKQHARWYWKVIAVFIVVGLVFGGVAVFQTLKLRQLETQAADVFYTMKTVELELAQIEDLVLDHLSPDQVQTILMKRDSVHSTLSRLEKNYESYLEDIGIYSKDMPPEDRLILRMTRLFGESEVKMPKGFVGEVKRYIQKWRSTNRLDKAIRRAVRHGYGEKIKEAMLAQHMLPEFFYLCLQESEFDLQAVGPPTRFGIAKGPWQFLPSTGVEYGLKTGPLVSINRFDPRDERHHFDKATEAAAKFLRFLYTTRAQASGLLVIASYNWGPTRISDLIEKLPPNPQDRNFWELLKKFKVPQQTKDYVFYIFSAAVIGEDPKLFGFSFDPPL
ncbi:MAG: lytic transglycosylase domain-containing protein [Nitrospirales bacterium]